jgi:hypothetical protein
LSGASKLARGSVGKSAETAQLGGCYPAKSFAEALAAKIAVACHICNSVDHVVKQLNERQYPKQAGCLQQQATTAARTT